MPKLLDRVSDVLRTRHYSPRTGQAYTQWIKQYILYNNKQYPAALGAPEVSAFLSYLALERKVSWLSRTFGDQGAAHSSAYEQLYATDEQFVPLSILVDDRGTVLDIIPGWSAKTKKRLGALAGRR